MTIHHLELLVLHEGGTHRILEIAEGIRLVCGVPRETIGCALDRRSQGTRGVSILGLSITGDARSVRPLLVKTMLIATTPVSTLEPLHGGRPLLRYIPAG